MGLIFGTSKRKIRSAVRQELDRRERQTVNIPPPTTSYNKVRVVQRNVSFGAVTSTPEDTEREQLLRVMRQDLQEAREQEDADRVVEVVSTAAEQLASIPGEAGTAHLREYCAEVQETYRQITNR